MIPSFIITGKPYEVIKWFVLIVLPAFSAAYFALGNQFGWPNTEQVIGTLAVVTTFLGTILGISSSNYNRSDAKFDGAINMEPSAVEPEKWVYNLDLNDDVATIADKSQLVFKVNNPIVAE